MSNIPEKQDKTMANTQAWSYHGPRLDPTLSCTTTYQYCESPGFLISKMGNNKNEVRFFSNIESIAQPSF